MTQSRWIPSLRRRFKSLNEKEIIALAISAEDDNGRMHRANRRALTSRRK